MRSGPVRSFWLSFLLTLAVVMPVMGGFALYVAAFPKQPGPSRFSPACRSTAPPEKTISPCWR